jgi:transcriptional regulator with XRE-family HTH domain
MIDEIGRKIYNLRTAADLTQDELASRAGLTDGFISQIERGRTSISIDSLKMILDALNVTLADFFRDDERERIVFGIEDRVEIEEGGSGRMQLLVPGATNREMEPALLTLTAGQSTALRPPFQGDVFGYVLKGRIQLQFGKEIHKVRAGKTFYFTADREHRISNPGNRDAELIWITAPPYF